jgi:SAM-dependent methyltransferase
MEYAHVADLYDSYVRTTFDLPFFLKETQAVSGEVLELMSGTGRLSLPLLEAGVRLTCVDGSPEMLQVLQRKLAARGLSAPVHAADVCTLELGQRFDLAFIPFHSLAELSDPADQQRALERIHAHLSPGGTFFCTLHNPRVRLRQVDGQLRLRAHVPLLERPGTLALWAVENVSADGSRVEGMQFFEEYDERGVMRAKRMVTIRFAVITREAFEAMAGRAGFQVEALYGDYTHAPFQEERPFMIWKLRR